jgi:hypothetical protein
MTQSSVDTNADRQRGSLWLMFLAGPVIYIVYFIVVWALAEFGCLAGIQELRPFGLNPIYTGVLALTVVAALVTFYIGLLTFRRWRELRRGPADSEEEDPLFMVTVGIWLNGMHIVVILLTAVPMLSGSACAWM